MRTIRILLIMLCLSLLAILPATAMTFEEALSGANQDIERDFGLPDYFQMQNVQGKPVNKETWAGRAVFAYGQPYAFQADRNFHRFLGYAMSGEPFTNIRLPHDAWAGGYLEDRNWIEAPWRNHGVSQVVAHEGGLPLDDNAFNNQPMLRESMRAGLDQEYTPSSLRGDNVAWEKYVHIFAPPTEYTWGMGRMWHQTANGQIWYKTVPMAPTKVRANPDFSVQFQEHQFEGVKPGDKISSKVTYKLNEDHSGPERAKIELYHDTMDGNEWPIADIHGHELAFQPGQEYTFDYKVTALDHNTAMQAVIRPVSSEVDIDWANNRDKADIIVKSELLCTDVSVTMACHPSGTRLVGWNTEVRVTIKRDQSGPNTGVAGGKNGLRIKYRFDGGYWQHITLKKGETITRSHIVNHKKAGKDTYTAEAWPDDFIQEWEAVPNVWGKYCPHESYYCSYVPDGHCCDLVTYHITDCYDPNNTATLSIPVDNKGIPIGDGSTEGDLTHGR